VNLELCTLHLQETSNVETLLSFLLFGDGCATALVTVDPTGIALGDFRAAAVPNSADLITWQMGEQGFRMHLSGKVPSRIAQTLRAELTRPGLDGILRGQGTQSIVLWAVHAGGRTVLDAVESGLSLHPYALQLSRAVLHECGNMSSATLMFVLQRMLRRRDSGHIPSGIRGLAIAFGPGMVVDTFRFMLDG
jgi:predicted naringenin-chalcone synthase